MCGDRRHEFYVFRSNGEESAAYEAFMDGWERVHGSWTVEWGTGESEGKSMAVPYEDRTKVVGGGLERVILDDEGGVFKYSGMRARFIPPAATSPAPVVITTSFFDPSFGTSPFPSYTAAFTALEKSGIDMASADARYEGTHTLAYVGGVEDLSEFCGLCGVPCKIDGGGGEEREDSPTEDPPMIAGLVGIVVLVGGGWLLWTQCFGPVCKTGVCKWFCECCCPKDGSAWWLEGGAVKNENWREENVARVQAVRVFENQRANQV